MENQENQTPEKKSNPTIVASNAYLNYRKIRKVFKIISESWLSHGDKMLVSKRLGVSVQHTSRLFGSEYVSDKNFSAIASAKDKDIKFEFLKAAIAFNVNATKEQIAAVENVAKLIEGDIKKYFEQLK